MSDMQHNARIQALGKVAVLMGGTSAERNISLQSGEAVLHALIKQGVDAHKFDPLYNALDLLVQYDRVFICLHGKYGEDGCIQGALEMLKIPYTGSGVMASAIAMDKWRTKLLWDASNIATPAFTLVKADSDFAAIEQQLGLPIFVKPANEGSSIGITKVKMTGQLTKAYQLAAKADPLVIAEQSIDAGEYTVGIIGNTTIGYQLLPVVRIVAKNEFYDYEAKYLSNETEFFCPSGLSATQESMLQQASLAAFKVIGCHGWGRVDFLMDDAGKHYFIEVNTSPGMTDHSLVPMAAKAVGMDFDALVINILELADVA